MAERKFYDRIPNPEGVMEYVEDIKTKFLAVDSAEDGVVYALVNVLSAIRDLAKCVDELSAKIDRLHPGEKSN